MPAIPAWPPESGVRLFVDEELTQGLTIGLSGGQAHYLGNVMRLKAGDTLALFDDRTGEWRGQIEAIGKRQIDVVVTAYLRPREVVPDLWLGAAPVRRVRYDMLAEKACELGVARFTPVLTRRAVVDKVNRDRLRAQMIEAAEQCGRSALPVIDAETRLSDWLRDMQGRMIFFADEGGGVPLIDAITANPGPAAILVGPEGGFDAEERASILATPGAVGVSLGPRILRAETAAMAAVAVWMAQHERYDQRTM